MEVKIKDAWLRGKSCITKQDVLLLIPETIIEQVTNVCVRIESGLPHWVISTDKPEVSFVYTPFSGKLKEMRCIKFGKIRTFRKGRYLRDEYIHKGTEKKVYTVYLCTGRAMYLWREIKEYWFDNGDGMGFSSKDRWFRAFP